MPMTLNGTTGIVLPTAAAPAFSAYLNSVQSVTASTWTKVTLDTEEFDTNNNFASSRFTPTVAGYYQIDGMVAWGFTTGINIVSIYKNGTLFKLGNFNTATSAGAGTAVSALVYFNGSTDYVDLYCYQTYGTANIATGAFNTYLQASMVRAA